MMVVPKYGVEGRTIVMPLAKLEVDIPTSAPKVSIFFLSLWMTASEQLAFLFQYTIGYRVCNGMFCLK